MSEAEVHVFGLLRKDLKKHVPEETFENLLMEEYNELIEIWKRESVKASGKKTGES